MYVQHALAMIQVHPIPWDSCKQVYPKSPLVKSPNWCQVRNYSYFIIDSFGDIILPYIHPSHFSHLSFCLWQSRNGSHLRIDNLCVPPVVVVAVDVLLLNAMVLAWAEDISELVLMTVADTDDHQRRLAGPQEHRVESVDDIHPFAPVVTGTADWTKVAEPPLQQRSLELAPVAGICLPRSIEIDMVGQA